MHVTCYSLKGFSCGCKMNTKRKQGLIFLTHKKERKSILILGFQARYWDDSINLIRAYVYNWTNYCGQENKIRHLISTNPGPKIEKSVCRSGSSSYNWTWNNRLVPNRKRSTSRLYIVTLLNFYAEYIMRNGGLDEAQAGVKIAGRNISSEGQGILLYCSPWGRKVRHNLVTE